MKKTRLTIELDAGGREILERMRGEMTPSAFFQLLLKMVDSGSVSAPLAAVREKRRKI